MGTRSYIGRAHEGGSVRAVYCHWDGYPDHNGRILVEHWLDPAKVDSLLDEGDLSSLGEELGSNHSFMGGPRGECTFYGRDRGASRTAARSYPCVSDFMEAAEGACAEFAYLHEGGRWRCWSLGSRRREIEISSRSSELWGS